MVKYTANILATVTRKQAMRASRSERAKGHRVSITPSKLKTKLILTKKGVKKIDVSHRFDVYVDPRSYKSKEKFRTPRRK